VKREIVTREEEKIMNMRNDQPQFEVVEPPFHECGHFHWSNEACPQEPCGSCLCCRPGDGPVQIFIDGPNYGTINM
jgi:hypothetical protein